MVWFLIGFFVAVIIFCQSIVWKLRYQAGYRDGKDEVIGSLKQQAEDFCVRTMSCPSCNEVGIRCPEGYVDVQLSCPVCQLECGMKRAGCVEGPAPCPRCGTQIEVS